MNVGSVEYVTSLATNTTYGSVNTNTAASGVDGTFASLLRKAELPVQGANATASQGKRTANLDKEEKYDEKSFYEYLNGNTAVGRDRMYIAYAGETDGDAGGGAQSTMTKTAASETAGTAAEASTESSGVSTKDLLLLLVMAMLSGGGSSSSFMGSSSGTGSTSGYGSGYMMAMTALLKAFGSSGSSSSLLSSLTGTGSATKTATAAATAASTAAATTAASASTAVPLAGATQTAANAQTSNQAYAQTATQTGATASTQANGISAASNAFVNSVLYGTSSAAGVSSGYASIMNTLTANGLIGEISHTNVTPAYTSADSVSKSEIAQNGTVVPNAAGKPTTPMITSNATNRSAQLYRNVISQFEVENSYRYAVKTGKDGATSTYCNIFMWDVTSAMGAEIPHYADRETGAPLKYPDVQGANYLNANRISDWLDEFGEEYGWYEVTAEQAQAMANKGSPAVTVWKNNEGGHGHVQVVSPSEDGTYDESRGVAIAQAGRRLRNYTYIKNIYSSRMADVRYFAHR